MTYKKMTAILSGMALCMGSITQSASLGMTAYGQEAVTEGEIWDMTGSMNEDPGVEKTGGLPDTEGESSASSSPGETTETVPAEIPEADTDNSVQTEISAGDAANNDGNKSAPAEAVAGGEAQPQDGEETKEEQVETEGDTKGAMEGGESPNDADLKDTEAGSEASGAALSQEGQEGGETGEAPGEDVPDIKPKETAQEEPEDDEKEYDISQECSRSDIGEYSFHNGAYRDASWYVKHDFRFRQVEKDYAICTGERSCRIYEEMSVGAKVVGEIPYFGLAYVLKEENGWSYIESGAVRGFIQSGCLMGGDAAKERTQLIGEDSFELARADVDASDNAAFTYTLTTTREVLAPKRHAFTNLTAPILEFPRSGARSVGEAKAGCLLYILEDTTDGWVFVESGDVRGFIQKEDILSGDAARIIADDMGEDTTQEADQLILPEENRSLYFTLSSTKSPASMLGENVASYALSFEGKLPYVYGGTSLNYGADCSGFTQSVFENFGIKLPRTAQEQGAAGEEVKDLSNAQPGDIVYYGYGPHVGIYIGDGKVIQCSGNEGNTAANPGKGPTISDAAYMPITSIRRYIIEADGSVDGLADGGYAVDHVRYGREELELIWAIVAQEDNGSYEGALAVISSAMNRSESPVWAGNGDNALAQLTSPGQYCYSLDHYWENRLGGNVPDYVKQAVNDCLYKGIRNHSHTSFRSMRGKTTGADAVQIGGNWYFGA